VPGREHVWDVLTNPTLRVVCRLVMCNTIRASVQCNRMISETGVPHNVVTSLRVSGGGIVFPSLTSSTRSVRIYYRSDVKVVLTLSSELWIGARPAQVPGPAWRILHQMMVAHMDVETTASLLIPGRFREGLLVLSNGYTGKLPLLGVRAY